MVCYECEIIEVKVIDTEKTIPPIYNRGHNEVIKPAKVVWKKHKYCKNCKQDFD
jgi:hypothetical protein